MSITVRSFAKINLGLRIGSVRPDGFHELRTVYQTIALHDIIRVEVTPGTGIEIRCEDPRVPTDESNTCYRIVERAMEILKARGRVIVEIEKRLPVQGGLGGASGNAAAALLALERAVKRKIPEPERLRIAAEVGSDLPLFLVGGTVLGTGHGEEVYPLPDLPAVPCVLALPEVSVSTPKAFGEWDARIETDGDCHSESASAVEESALREPAKADSSGDESPLGMTKARGSSKLTHPNPSDRMMKFGRVLTAWLSSQSERGSGKILSGVSAKRRGRAETPLLDLVRAGIENDFEQVVFPQHPELCEIKSVLKRAGAFYASLSGSGSAVYGLFRTSAAAQNGVAALEKAGTTAVRTSMLTRRQYWRKIFDC